MNTSELQNKARDLVSRDVFFCVSTLVSELAKDEKYMDELLPIMVQDDWEEAAIDAGCFEDDDGDICGPEENQVFEDWQTACEELGLDPYQREACEHWLVSGWLADKLEAKGEMILRDFLGLAIWGRTTTGQAIYIDRVIEEIVVELYGEDAE